MHSNSPSEEIQSRIFDNVTISPIKGLITLASILIFLISVQAFAETPEYANLPASSIHVSSGQKKELILPALKNNTVMELIVEFESLVPEDAQFTVLYDTGRRHQILSEWNSPNRPRLAIIPPTYKGPIRLSLKSGKSDTTFKIRELLREVDSRFVNMPQDEFRLREKFFPKADDEIRVLVVGNSTIRGTCNDEFNTLTHYLERKIRAISDRKINVINYAKGSWFLNAQVFAYSRCFLDNGKWPIAGAIGNPNDPTYCFDTKDIWASASRIIINDTKDQKAIENILHSYKLIRDHQPDLIVISSLWNDINEFFNVRVTTQPADCTETHPCHSADEGYRAFVEYYESLLEWYDKPRADSRRDVFVAATKYRAIYYSSSTAEGQIAAKRIYRYLLEKFISEAGEKNVMLMTLPYRGEGIEGIWSHRDFMKIGTGYTTDADVTAVFKRYEMVQRIQNEVINEVAREKALPLVDASSIFAQKFRHLTAKQYIDRDAICDPVHLNNNGNEAVAESMLQPIMDMLSRKIQD